MNRIWSKLVAILLLGAVSQVVADEKLVQVQSSASVSAYEVGKSFDVALQGHITPPWHAYYRNPGTVGQAATATLQAPAGFQVEGPYWQVPTRHSSVSTAYVYDNPVVVWRVTPQSDAPAEAHFVVKLGAQVCSDSGCLPVQTAEATLDMQQGSATPNPGWQDLERKVETLGDTALPQLSATRGAGSIVLRFQHTGSLEQAYFFSDDNTIDPTAELRLTHEGDMYELTLPLNNGKNLLYPAPAAAASIKQITGMLTLSDGTHTRVDVPIERAAVTMPGGLWETMLGLFLGGLLLNLMPCVFPVLGLKIMSFVSLGGGSQRRVVWHSLAFVLGILLSFWVLGIILVGLSNAELLAQSPVSEWFGILWGDAGSGTRSWAAWMENEWVVYIVTLLFLVMALWMYGVFELGARATGVGSELQSKGGYVGSFFQGLFITLVATPCSAPYLGTAMAATLAFPAVWLLTSLTAMAVGFALPYLLLGIFPSLVRLLPRPGAWMESLKQGLSFLLFGAAVWMLDVYISGWQSGSSLRIFLALVVFCAGFWVFGRWCALYRSKLCRVVGFIVALALVGAGVWKSMPGEAEKDAPEWVEWSPKAMQEALDEGCPVYVDFTAKWCTTCQWNKGVAYSKEVLDLLNEYDVVLMRADKTRHNPDIDAELGRLNRTAVPTNALYMPDAEPAVTRELLSADYLLEFLKEHLAK